MLVPDWLAFVPLTTRIAPLLVAEIEGSLKIHYEEAIMKLLIDRRCSSLGLAINVSAWLDIA